MFTEIEVGVNVDIEGQLDDFLGICGRKLMLLIKLALAGWLATDTKGTTPVGGWVEMVVCDGERLIYMRVWIYVL